MATTMRWSAGWSVRSMSGSGGKAHLPEIGFEPGGGRERRGERGKAPFPAAPGELLVERRRHLARQLLVFVAGIHLEPVAVGIAGMAGRRIGHPLGGDLSVTDHAG